MPENKKTPEVSSVPTQAPAPAISAPAPTPIDASAFGAALAEEIKKLAAAQNPSLFRNLPLEPESYPFGPDNYDVRKAAKTYAEEKNGHDMGPWRPAAEGVPNFWQARCRSCRAHLYARYDGPSPDKLSPHWGGDAYQFTEEQFSRGRSSSGFSTSAIEVV